MHQLTPAASRAALLLTLAYALGCGEGSPTGNSPRGPATGAAKPTPATGDSPHAPAHPPNAANFDVYAQFVVDSLNWAARRVTSVDAPVAPNTHFIPLGEIITPDTPPRPEAPERRTLILRYAALPVRGEVEFKCRIKIDFIRYDSAWATTGPVEQGEFDFGDTPYDVALRNEISSRHTDFISSLFVRTHIMNADAPGEKPR